jgi:hypothetical protein
MYIQNIDMTNDGESHGAIFWIGVKLEGLTARILTLRSRERVSHYSQADRLILTIAGKGDSDISNTRCQEFRHMDIALEATINCIPPWKSSQPK